MPKFENVNILLKNILLGRHWYESFIRRYPMISVRVTQNLVKCRTQATEEKIRSWFGEISKYFEENGLTDALNNADRIFNCDESAFYLSPKDKTVLAKRGDKTVYSFVANDEKECLTVLIMGSANGVLSPPMVIFPYKRVPEAIVESLPEKWALGRSESGWMTGETFFEYIANVFYPSLVERKIKFPVILFVDGHTSHLTMNLSEFCREKAIVLVALLPNSTHILQPLDVSVFHPLKLEWKSVIKDFRLTNDGNKIRRQDFAPLVQTALENGNISENLKVDLDLAGCFR